MCDCIATSEEHVPPKCLFPETKDVLNKNDYRKNLIKVPSCDEHNLSKSKNDEYLLIAFSIAWCTTNYAKDAQLNKLLRINKRTPHVIYEILKNRQPVNVFKDNSIISTYKYNLDYSRVVEQIIHVAYGIHFHHYKTRAANKPKIIVATGMKTELPSFNKNQRIITEKYNSHLKSTETHGENQDVFYYQAHKSSNEVVIRLVFYKDLKFIAIFPS